VEGAPIAALVLFLIAGAWFAYWLRQDALQRTHLMRLQLAVAGSL
jgi:hypothetical protein